MKGLTLFEVLVALLIFSVIAMGLGYAVVAGKNALFVSDIPTQLRQNVLFALLPMERELRQTAPKKIIGLEEGASSNSITFPIPRYNDNTGVIDWGQNITYSCNGLGQLTRTSNGVTSVIAPNIATLTFSRPSGEETLIQIDITVQKADGKGNLYQDAEQAIIKMRSKEE
ncbi:MAG: prepilin-type N-terminal cleavage/methylation domain-containing protein [Candidatus Omnitrophica bacterium]|nr:prepilin-type N-terminal cleavage/methylation domain-containing protein [Candidatus Omnitrophota bacterium]